MNIYERIKKMNQINNEILVIGADHYNALGVIRSLGESGIKPIFILVSNDKFCMSAASKYIKKLIRINSNNFEDILPLLDNEFNNLKHKPIIIPTGDPIACLLDKNYSKLSKKYLIPNIQNKEGMIIKHMNKTYQEKLCNENDIPIAKSYLINLNKYQSNIVNKLPEKVIIKPVSSFDGKKNDIVICDNEEEILQNLEILSKKGYSQVMIQEFLEYEMEYAMMGLSYKGKVYIPGINSNNYIYPSGRGNTSYAKMFPTKNFMFDISNIEKMISKMNYTGLFEVEAFKVGDKLYFNEMNFRNSANLFAYSGNKVNYIYLYLLLVSGHMIKNEKIYVDKPYSFCIEMLHLGNVKEGKIGLFKCIKNILSSTTLIFNIKDLKPFFVKIIHSIYRRISKQK